MVILFSDSKTDVWSTSATPYKQRTCAPACSSLRPLHATPCTYFKLHVHTMSSRANNPFKLSIIIHDRGPRFRAPHRAAKRVYKTTGHHTPRPMSEPTDLVRCERFVVCSSRNAHRGGDKIRFDVQIIIQSIGVGSPTLGSTKSLLHTSLVPGCFQRYISWVS